MKPNFGVLQELHSLNFGDRFDHEEVTVDQILNEG